MPKRATKKPNILGSLYYERTDKRGLRVYRLEYPGGSMNPATGRHERARCRVHVRDEAEAYRELRAWGQALEQEEQQPAPARGADMPFRDWAAIYLERIARELRPRTVQSYRAHFELRILPRFGALPLGAITPALVKAWLHDMGQAGAKLAHDGEPVPGERLSQGTIMKHYRTLSYCLRDAVYEGHLPANPADAVRRPRVPKYQPRYYTPEEMTRLIAAVQQQPLRLRAIVLLILASGVRIGEANALTWSSVDLDQRTITVRQAAEYVVGQPRAVKTTKNELVRVVPLLLEEAVEALHAWRAAQQAMPAASAQRRHGGDFICTGARGWLSTQEMDRLFGRFIREQSLPLITPHGLRHSFATYLLSRGVPINQVQRYLGHTTPYTTLTHYAHAIPADDTQPRALMQSLTQPPNSPPENPEITPTTSVDPPHRATLENR